MCPARKRFAGTCRSSQSSRIDGARSGIHRVIEIAIGLGLPQLVQKKLDRRLEFTGENIIDHTPRDETVRLDTGFAFDLVGERKRTHLNVRYFGGGAKFVTDPNTGAPIAVEPAEDRMDERFVDESFEISVRNRKQEAAEIRVIEHLYRGLNWEIQRPSSEFTKLDARTIEFRVSLKPGEEKKVEYTVHYTW